MRVAPIVVKLRWQLYVCVAYQCMPVSVCAGYQSILAYQCMPLLWCLTCRFVHGNPSKGRVHGLCYLHECVIRCGWRRQQPLLLLSFRCPMTGCQALSDVTLRSDQREGRVHGTCCVSSRKWVSSLRTRSHCRHGCRRRSYMALRHWQERTRRCALSISTCLPCVFHCTSYGEGLRSCWQEFILQVPFRREGLVSTFAKQVLPMTHFFGSLSGSRCISHNISQ